MSKSAIGIIVILVVALAGTVIYDFYRTTTASTSTKLFLPKKETSSIPDTIKPENILTMLLDNSDKIFYYTGSLIDRKQVKQTDFNNIRAILLLTKQKIGERDLFVVIKPSAVASYKNTVDMLDEMMINKINKYTLVDITETEQEIVNTLSESSKN